MADIFADCLLHACYDAVLPIHIKPGGIHLGAFSQYNSAYLTGREYQPIKDALDTMFPGGKTLQYNYIVFLEKEASNALSEREAIEWVSINELGIYICI